MVVHWQHSLSAAVNHQMITAFYIGQLHSSTMVAATAISHIKRHLILMRIDKDLKDQYAATVGAEIF